MTAAADARDRVARRLLAAAAIVAAVQAIAHAILFLGERPQPGSVEARVRAVMETRHFEAGGAPNSYWHMYFGYGVLAALSAFATAALTAVLARYGSPARATARAVLLVLIAETTAHAALTASYFFVLPVMFDAAVLVLMLAAWVLMRETAT